MRRVLLQLAHRYDSNQARVTNMGGWMLSEKIDGIRCFWDGGITRDMPKADVPWANCAKDGRYKEEQISTGLWSRYGNIIHAHPAWLDTLPLIPLDGELYLGRGEGTRQRLTKITKTLIPTIEWMEVSYYTFDTVPLMMFGMDGEIKDPNFTKILRGVRPWLERHLGSLDWSPSNNINAEASHKCMLQRIPEGSKAIVHEQLSLPARNEDAREMIEELFNNYTAQGGEGVMVRNPIAGWQPFREYHILKYKEVKDDDGVIMGFITGKETDLGSKLLGKIGSIIIKLDSGKLFQLSGFTDDERTFVDERMVEWAIKNPGEECPASFNGVYFNKGDRITFRYRELTADGYPSEGRYWRKRSGHD